MLFNFPASNTKIPLFKGTRSRFFASGFFHESSSPKPMKIALGSLQIFSKFFGDIRKSRYSTGIKDTGGQFGNSIRLLHDDLEGKKVSI
jgi:hypothetical protein